jgi:hypothetical protein
MGNLLHFPKRPEPPARPDPPVPQPDQATPEPPIAPKQPVDRPAQSLRTSGTTHRAPSFLRFLQKGWETTKLALRLNSSSAIKSAQAVLLAVAVCFSVGASSDSGARMNVLSHRLMCQCGCAQLLGECDHVGCPSRDKELGELSSDMAAGLTDKQILDDFVGKYGMVVLAAPPTTGFNLVAWIAPFAVFAAALLGTILLIRRWGGLRGFKPQSANEADIAALDPAERERREKIRRETDGGSSSDGQSGPHGGTSR